MILYIIKSKTLKVPPPEKLYSAFEQLNLLKPRVYKTILNNNHFKEPPISSISLNVAQICNMKCIYCYGDEGEYGDSGVMDEEIALKTVGMLIEKSYDKKDISIAFFGGEPLLNFELIKKVVKYANIKAKENNKNIKYGLTTNGTRFNKEINKFLNTNKFAVTISFDGDRSLQDKNRPMKGKQSSFDYIKPKIDTFLLSRNGRAGARVTLTKYSKNVSNIRSELKGQGFKKVNLVPVSADKCYEYTFDLTDYEKFSIDIELQAEEMICDIKKGKTINKAALWSVVEVLWRKAKKKFYCGAGKGLVAVSTNGGIYPCHRFVGNSDFRMGIVSKTVELKNRRNFLSNQIERSKTCNNCWVRYFCGGGCYHENFVNSNDLFNPHNAYCKIMKKYAEMAIYIYDSLSKKERVAYFK